MQAARLVRPQLFAGRALRQLEVRFRRQLEREVARRARHENSGAGLCEAVQAGALGGCGYKIRHPREARLLANRASIILEHETQPRETGGAGVSVAARARRCPGQRLGAHAAAVLHNLFFYV